MFTTINELKGLFVDLDSIPESFDSQWDGFTADTKVLFCGRNAARLETMKSRNKMFHIYGETPFHQGIFHAKRYGEILESMELRSYETAAVVGDANALRHALNANIAVILIAQEMEMPSELLDILPDYVVSSAEELKGILERKNPGYFAEYQSEQYADKNGSWDKAGIFTAELAVDQFPACRLAAAGRYFSQNDPRAYGHQLSRRILLHKREETAQTKAFTEIYKRIIRNFAAETFDTVMRIPPKDSRQFDRFSEIACDIAEDFELDDLSERLICVRKYGSQRTLNWEERHANVENVFKINGDLRGRNILLLDDILTSGATVREAARQMYRCGARNVTIVVLAIKQHKNNFLEGRLRPVKCPKCGGELQLRINRHTQEAFFGCKELYNKENPCTYIEGYRSAMERRNQEAEFFSHISYKKA